MGMFDDAGYDPSNPNDQTQQYKKPGSDPFAEYGIQTPMQKMLQAQQYQNMIQQNQMARQQQMLAIQSQMQNMGVNASQAMSGLAGPSLMMMGGGQPAFQGKLTNAVNQFLPGGGLNGGGQQQQQGMTPPGQQVLNGMGDEQILTNALAANQGDKPAALRQAAKAFLARGDNTSIMTAGRLLNSADDLDKQQKKDQSVIGKNDADAAEAQARTKEIQATTTKPSDLGSVNFPNGDTGRAIAQYDPISNKWNMQAMFRGQQIQRTLDETPAQRGKEVDDFREATNATINTVKNIDNAKKLISQGAAVGTVAETAVGTVNTVLGTLKQLMPGGVDLDTDAAQYLDKMQHGDFQKWAQRTSVNESVLNDLTMNLAKSYAGGGKVSVTDIKRAAETIGEHIGDPKTFGTVLDSVKDRALQNYETRYNSYKSSVNSPDEKQKMDNLHGLVIGQSQPGDHPDDIKALLQKYTQ